MINPPRQDESQISAQGNPNDSGFGSDAFVRIEAPHQHWHMFVGDTPPSSRNWLHIEETTETHSDHDKLMDMVVDNATNRGIGIVRYGADAFLTNNPDAVAQDIDLTLVRYTGKVGQRPLLTIIDIYGRKHPRWGSKA